MTIMRPVFVILRALRVGLFAALAALAVLACSPATAQSDIAACPDTAEGNPTPDFLVPWEAQYGAAVFGRSSPQSDPKFQQQVPQLQVDTLALLLQLNDAIQTPLQITCVRRWQRDDQLVDYLLPLAAGSDSRYRVTATLVLENIVDNTNVCRVISTLSNGAMSLDDNARYDLLLIIAQVAHYAYQDTGIWITTAVNEAKAQLADGSQYAKTLSLLALVEDTLQHRNAGLDTKLEDRSATSYRKCALLLPEQFPRDPNALQASAPAESSPQSNSLSSMR